MDPLIVSAFRPTDVEFCPISLLWRLQIWTWIEWQFTLHISFVFRSHFFCISFAKLLQLMDVRLCATIVRVVFGLVCCNFRAVLLCMVWRYCLLASFFDFLGVCQRHCLAAAHAVFVFFVCGSCN